MVLSGSIVLFKLIATREGTFLSSGASGNGQLSLTSCYFIPLLLYIMITFYYAFRIRWLILMRILLMIIDKNFMIILYLDLEVTYMGRIYLVFLT
jgi:hypothetical protein